jgi:hypothetical protein
MRVCVCVCVCVRARERGLVHIPVGSVLGAILEQSPWSVATNSTADITSTPASAAAKLESVLFLGVKLGLRTCQHILKCQLCSIFAQSNQQHYFASEYFTCCLLCFSLLGGFHGHFIEPLGYCALALLDLCKFVYTHEMVTRVCQYLCVRIHSCV